MPTAAVNRHCPVILPLVATALLAGCGGPPDTSRFRHDASHANAPAAAAADPTADMVSAVSASEAQPPVYLKFRLASAPRVGETVSLELALVQEPKLEIESLKLFLQVRDGLVLRGTPAIDFGRPEVGAMHTIPVTLLAQQAGVTSIAVTVLVDTERDSVTRTFHVPLVVAEAAPPGGAPAVAAPAAPAANATAARGSKPR